MDLSGVNYSYALLGGDFNCELLKDSSHYRIINNRFRKIGFELCNAHLEIPCNIKYTFFNEKRNAYSYIDHFYISSSNTKSLCSLKTNHDFENLSDHLPVVLNLKNEALLTRISNTPAPAHYINSRPIVIDNCN